MQISCSLATCYSGLFNKQSLFAALESPLGIFSFDKVVFLSMQLSLGITKILRQWDIAGADSVTGTTFDAVHDTQA